VSAPIWVQEHVVLRAHQKVIDQHGGLHGIRVTGLLESALHRPRMAYFYENPTSGIVDLAAIHYIAISDAQPFIAGNKRTGSAVCHLFLWLNGFGFDRHDNDERVEVFVKAANHRVSGFGQAELSAWIRQHVLAL
jgi:death-on-curing protein